MAETGQERTEEATAKRKREARTKGSVAKSMDLTNAAVMTSMLLVAPTAFSGLGKAFMGMMKTSLKEFPTDVTAGHIKPILTQITQVGLPPIAMITGTAMGVGLVANFAQVGFVLSPEAMVPNWQKINPAKGLKNLFSSTGAFNAVKAFAKASVFGYQAYDVISSNWTKVGTLAFVPASHGIASTGDLILQISKKVVVTWVVIAAIDFFVQRAQLAKNLRMTKEEVKREFKESESNPEMKGRRLQRMRRMIRSRMRQAVKTADVVVTNPTHFSVAIRYEKGKVAPTVVAKGQDHAAFRVREFAKEFEIPIVPNPPLARALYRQCEIGDYVPRELFQSVAEVLAYVYKTLKQVRGAA